MTDNTGLTAPMVTAVVKLQGAKSALREAGQMGLADEAEDLMKRADDFLQLVVSGKYAVHDIGGGWKFQLFPDGSGSFVDPEGTVTALTVKQVTILASAFQPQADATG